MKNVNTFDKESTEIICNIELSKKINHAEQFVKLNLDDSKKIVVYPAGSCRLQKLINEDLEAFKNKDVLFYDYRGSFINRAKENLQLDVKQVNDVTELQSLKDIDSVVSINEAEKAEDIKQFFKDILSIPAKKHFIVLSKISKNGQEIGKNQIIDLPNSYKKIISNVFSENALKELGSEFGMQPISYSQGKDEKGNIIPDPDGISNCVVFAKQVLSKAEENEIKKEAAEIIAGIEPEKKESEKKEPVKQEVKEESDKKSKLKKQSKK